MAGLRNRIVASTLIEVMVGMVIISIMFTSSFVILANIGRFYKPRQIMYTSLIIDDIYQKMIEEGRIVNETISRDGITIEKKVENYKNNPELQVVTFEGYNKKNLLICKKNYIIVSSRVHDKKEKK